MTASAARYAEAKGIIAQLLVLKVAPVNGPTAVVALRAQLASELAQRGVVGGGEKKK